MPVYEFKCKLCDKRYEFTRPEADHSCTECMGPLVRVWAAALLRENIRAVRG